MKWFAILTILKLAYPGRKILNILMLVLENFFEYVYVSPENFLDYAYVRDHSLFMTGGGLAKKGEGHEVFLTKKGGGT